MLSNYRVPGVYVERTINRGIPAVSPGFRIPVFIGPGSNVELKTATYNNVDLNLAESETTSIDLPDDCVRLLRAGTASGGNDLFDYDTAIGGACTNSSYSIEATYDDTSSPKTLTFAVSGGGNTQGLSDTDDVYVTYYASAPSSRYDFTVYYNLTDLQLAHGGESAENLVSVAGALAFANGAPAVGIIQLDFGEANPLPGDGFSSLSESDWTTAFETAIEKLDEVPLEQCRIVVPVLPTTSVITESFYHTNIVLPTITSVRNASTSTEARWRVALFGVLTASDKSAMLTSAQSLANFVRNVGSPETRRFTVIAPDVITRSVKQGYTSTTLTLNGTLLAAAAAGKICGLDKASKTITNQIVSGLTLERTISKQDRITLGGNGVTVFYTRDSLVYCNHWITTDLTAAETQEGNITEVEDFVKQYCLNLLSDQFVGRLISSTTLSEVSAYVDVMLTTLTSRGIIRGFENVDVSTSDDPRTIAVSFSLLPLWPANWIDVTFMFGV